MKKNPWFVPKKDAGIAENGTEGYFCRECSEGFRVFALGGVGREGESVLNQKIGI